MSPVSCIKNFVNGKIDSMKKTAKDIWNKMKEGASDAFDKAKKLYADFKNREKIRAQKMVEDARQKLQERYPGKDFGKEGDFLQLPYDKQVNNMEDFADLVKYTEGLFPDASRGDIVRMLRGSTNYGPRGTQDLATHPNPAIAFIFGNTNAYANTKLGKLIGSFFSGGQLQNFAGYPNDFSGIINGREVSVNGKPVDIAHVLIGADSYYNQNWVTSSALYAVSKIVSWSGGETAASSFYQGALKQMNTDFADFTNPLFLTPVMDSFEQGNIGINDILPTMLGQANLADLRANIIGAEIGRVNGSFSSALNSSSSNMSNWTSDVDFYETNVYNPIQSGVPASQVMPAVQELTTMRSNYGVLGAQINNLNTIVSDITGSGFLKKVLIKKDALHFAESDFNLNINFDDYGVDLRKGNLNLVLIPNYVSYSNDSLRVPNKDAFPFSVFNSFVLSENQKEFLVTQNSKSELFSSSGVDYSSTQEMSKLTFTNGYMKFSEKMNGNKFISEIKSDKNNASAFLYDNNKLVYVAKPNKVGNYLYYENNLLKEIFAVYDGYYFMKYTLNYNSGKLDSVELSSPYSELQLKDYYKINYYPDGKIKEFISNKLKREFEYDSIGRVISQKLNVLDKAILSFNYEYQANKTIVSEYYKDFEILLKTTTYSFEGNNVSTSVEENISLEEVIYIEELIQESVEGLESQTASINAVLRGISYSSSASIKFNPSNAESFALRGAPDGKAEVYFTGIKNSLVETIQVTLPSAGKTSELELNYAFALIPITIGSDYGDVNSVPAYVKMGELKSMMILKKEDAIVLAVKAGEEKEISVTIGEDEKKINLRALTKGELVILDSIDFNLKFENKKYKVFDCNGHYAYVKYDVNHENQEIYFDGVKIDETMLTQDLTIFDNHIAYSKRAYFDSDGNLCGYDYNKFCDYEQYVVYDGKLLGKGDEPYLWGNHIGYCDSNHHFVYDGIVFEDSSCYVGPHSGYSDFGMSHNNYAYLTEDGSVIWNGKKITDSNDSPRHLVWVEGNNLLTVKANSDYDSNDFYAVFKNGELVQTGSVYDEFASSIGTIWDKKNNGNLGKNGFEIENSDYSYTIFGENYILDSSNSNLIFNGYLLPFNVTCYGCYNLFDNHYSIAVKEGLFIDGKKVSDLPIEKHKLFEDNWLGYISNDKNYDFYFNGEYVGSGPRDTRVLFGKNYAFNSNEGLIYNGKLIYKLKSRLYGASEAKLFGDHIFWVDYNDGYEYYIDGNLIGDTDNMYPLTSNLAVWPALDGDWSGYESVDYYPQDEEFLKAWDYCMKYPSEIETKN